MGWKGTLRSLQAASRASERNARRRQRELERRRKEIAKLEALEQAALEVEEYENYIEVLTSLHHDCGESLNWRYIATALEPIEPKRRNSHEENARKQLASYEPTFIDRALRRSESRLSYLQEAVERAKERDEEEYTERLREFEREHKEWEANRAIAEGVLQGIPDAYDEAIRQIDPFSEIRELGSSIDYRAVSGELVEVSVRVNDHRVVPRQKKTLLKSGKLSVKEMPKTHYWALYQDYVCGMLLRVARELFVLLPVEMVIVTALADILNTTTGHLEEQPILSAALPRATMKRLNFARLDPSDSMENFVHNMKFYKTKGFVAVESIRPEDLKLE